MAHMELHKSEPTSTHSFSHIIAVNFRFFIIHFSTIHFLTGCGTTRYCLQNTLNALSNRNDIVNSETVNLKEKHDNRIHRKHGNSIWRTVSTVFSLFMHGFLLLGYTCPHWLCDRPIAMSTGVQLFL